MSCLVFADTSPELSGFRIWDLSLERDAEEEAEFRAKMKEQANAPEDLPPQLLFAHQVVLLMMALEINQLMALPFVAVSFSLHSFVACKE
jgi:hypothetical protein